MLKHWYWNEKYQENDMNRRYPALSLVTTLADILSVLIALSAFGIGTGALMLGDNYFVSRLYTIPFAVFVGIIGIVSVVQILAWADFYRCIMDIEKNTRKS